MTKFYRDISLSSEEEKKKKRQVLIKSDFKFKLEIQREEFIEM